MSRILDFYAVRWEYEPHTFPILWNLDGDVVESFSPDFYLPDLDLYLEMTTLRQKLVRKKNRKLRRLRELYPDLNVKLFYARDFRALMLKYGKLALVRGPVRDVRPGRRRRTASAEPTRSADADAEPLPIGRPDAVAADDRRAADVAVRRVRAAAVARRRAADAGHERTGDRADDAIRSTSTATSAEILLTEERDRGQGARARGADQRRLRRPAADPRVGAQGLAAVHGRPDARDRHPGPDRPDGGQLVRRHDDRIVGPRADPQGPLGEHRRRGRADRRGHHRHRA